MPDPLTLVYLGNLSSVAKKLAALPGTRLTACVVEAGDREVDEFRALTDDLGCDLFVVNGKDALGAALRTMGKVDLGVIANFGIILSYAQIAFVKRGFVNAHLGLLPEYPGRNPIADALRRRETVTGVTLHRVTAQVDGGPILQRRQVPLSADAKGIDVFERLSRVAAEMLADHVRFELAKNSP